MEINLHKLHQGSPTQTQGLQRINTPDEYRETPVLQIPSIDFNGVWKNDLGSEMDIQVSLEGAIKGKYRTATGRPAPSEEFEIVGFVSTNIIGFTVNFGKYDSITSWVGQYTLDVNGNATIQTLWHLGEYIEGGGQSASISGVVLSGTNSFFKSSSGQ